MRGGRREGPGRCEVFCHSKREWNWAGLFLLFNVVLLVRATIKATGRHSAMKTQSVFSPLSQTVIHSDLLPFSDVADRYDDQSHLISTVHFTNAAVWWWGVRDRPSSSTGALLAQTKLSRLCFIVWSISSRNFVFVLMTITFLWSIAVLRHALLILCGEDSVAHLHRCPFPFPPTATSSRRRRFAGLSVAVQRRRLPVVE